jgi:hypothetical protein
MLVSGICFMQGSSSSNSHAGHAFLHDFCMTIPYGGIAALSGLLAFAFKAPAVGLQLAAVAAVVALCSILSLKSWKAGGSSTAYTLVSAGEISLATHFITASAQLLYLAAAAVGHQHTYTAVHLRGACHTVDWIHEHQPGCSAVVVYVQVPLAGSRTTCGRA